MSEKMSLDKLFLMDDGEDIHAFRDGEYVGVLDVALYKKVVEKAKKTAQYTTEPKINVFLFDEDDVLNKIPEEFRYYNDEIKTIMYKDKDGDMKELFRSDLPKENQGFLVAFITYFTAVVLSEGIINKMKNRGMIPREADNKDDEFVDIHQYDYEIENPRTEKFVTELNKIDNPPPGKVYSGDLKGDFIFTKERTPKIWEAITKQPWKGIHKSNENQAFTQEFIDDLIDVEANGFKNVTKKRAKEIWDYLFVENLVVWSRPSAGPGPTPGPGPTLFVSDGVGAMGQRTRLSQSEHYGLKPYKNLLPAGTPLAVRDYAVRRLVPESKRKEGGFLQRRGYNDLSELIDDDAPSPNDLEVGVVVQITDFGHMFWPNLCLSQFVLRRNTAPTTLYMQNPVVVCLQMNDSSGSFASIKERVPSYFADGAIGKKKYDLYERYLKTKERTDAAKVATVPMKSKTMMHAPVKEYMTGAYFAVMQPPLNGFAHSVYFKGITEMEYCVVTIDLNELANEYGLVTSQEWGIENFEGEFSYVLPMCVVVDDGLPDYMKIHISQSSKIFHFTPLYNWDRNLQSGDGWDTDYKELGAQHMIYWFYFKYGMVPTCRVGNTWQTPAVPIAMFDKYLSPTFSSPRKIESVKEYGGYISQVGLSSLGREIAVRDEGAPWIDGKDVIFKGLTFEYEDIGDENKLLYGNEYRSSWDVYSTPHYAHWDSKHNDEPMVNSLADIGSTTLNLTAPAPSVSTKVKPKKKPDPSVADPSDEDLVPDEEPTVDADEVEAPNLAYIETTDGGKLGEGLYPMVDYKGTEFEFRKIFLSDLWRYKAWKKDKLMDVDALDEIWNDEKLEYMLLLNFNTKDIAFKEFQPEYREITDDEWFGILDVLDLEEKDVYVLLAKTLENIHGQLGSLGGSLWPTHSPTHVLVVTDDSTEGEIEYGWEPIQTAESIKLFDLDSMYGRKAFRDFKDGIVDSPIEKKSAVITAVSKGIPDDDEIIHDLEYTFLSRWEDWKRSLFEKLSIGEDRMSQTGVMLRIKEELDADYPKDEGEALAVLREHILSNPPVVLTDRVRTETPVDRSTIIQRLSHQPKGVEYKYKVPLMPLEVLKRVPAFHYGPVKVETGSVGDEVGMGEARRILKVADAIKNPVTDPYFTREVMEGMEAIKLLPTDEDEKITESVERLKETSFVEVKRRVYEPERGPAGHLKRVADIYKTIGEIFAFADRITHEAVICSALNPDWVTLLKGIPGTGKTVMAHLLGMTFMNDIDFQAENSMFYDEDIVMNYLYDKYVYGVCKHNQDKQPEEVFYEIEIRMTEAEVPRGSVKGTRERYSSLSNKVDAITSVKDWEAILEKEYPESAFLRIKDIIRKKDDWSEFRESDVEDIRDASEWIDEIFTDSIRLDNKDVPPLTEVLGIRENMPEFIRTQVEEAKGHSRLSSIRDYMFSPSRKPIVKSLFKYHNEANRANANVADTMLGLIAEKKVEYLGVPLTSPVYGGKFPCLHYLDYNPHLDMGANQELDRALLDRANMGIYVREAGVRGRQQILEAKFGVRPSKDGDASMKKVEEQLIDKARAGDFIPLSYIELQEVWNVVQQIPLSVRQLALINMITQHFSMIYKRYEGSEAYDFNNLKTEEVNQVMNDIIDAKRRKYFTMHEDWGAEGDVWKPNFVDTSTITYLNAKQQGGEEVTGVGSGSFTKVTLMNLIDRELGLRSAQSLVGLIKAYSYLYTALQVSRGKMKEPKTMDDFVVRDEWIPMLLSYVIEHRINIGVKGILANRFFNFGDFVDAWYLPQVLIMTEGETKPPLWERWKVWLVCAHREVTSSNRKELLENVVEECKAMKEKYEKTLPKLSASFDSYIDSNDKFKHLRSDIENEPTIAAIYRSVPEE